MQIIYLFILIFALTSCGGGGGGGSTTSTGTTTSSYSGVAIDGNLFRATAFLDLNGNGTYDSGEPTATTDSSGAFTLTATADQISSHSVVVSAIAGTTIDQDTPNTPITSGMTLMAPAGSPSVVSPLTTQVAAKMAGGMTLTAAKSAVQTELGLTNIDVTKNYVSEKSTNAAYLDAHKVAASIAEVLKNIDQQSSTDTTLASKLSSLTTQVTSSVAPITTQIKSASSLDDARTAINSQIGTAVNVYTIGGSISGLSASGLILASGTNTVSPSSTANSFTFSSKKATNGIYAVTVQANPTGQTCTISNGSGTVASQSITNIAVTCTTNTRTLSGTISGLTTSGLVLKNGSDEITVSSGASTFQFSSAVTSGATYAATVKTQPTGKTCSIANGSGTMSDSGVSNVQVTCSNNSYTLGGSISGLSVSGLKLKNGSEVLTVSSGSNAFTFSTTVAYGGGYSVTVDTQPTGYTCNLINSSGTMSSSNITSVQVSCGINTYNIGGTVSGLNGGLVLKLGSTTNNLVTGAISFNFLSAAAYGDAYSVSIFSQPLTSRCVLSNASGTVGTADVTNIQVTCTPTYSIGGSLSGYTGTGLVLRNSTELITVASNASQFVFANKVTSGSAYAVSVDTQPSNMNCSVSTASGVATSNVTSVNISCVPLTVTTYAGADGVTFLNPSGLGFDSSGNLFVVDTAHFQIKKVTPSGVVSTYAGSGARGWSDGIGVNATFGEMWYLAIDSQDNIYVADQSNCRIRKITPTVAVVSTIIGIGCTNRSLDGNEGYAELYMPIGISVDGSDNLWITEGGNVKKITNSGSHWVIQTQISGLTNPNGISASKANDYVYISLTSNGVIRFTRSNGATDILGGVAGNVYGVDSDTEGNIYYYGFSTNKIYRGSITSQSSTSSAIAGSGVAGTANGIGTSATFASPSAGAIGPDGNLYISDNAGQVVRKLRLK